MTGEQKAAVDRVRAFITSRQQHRQRIGMFGAAGNPMPELICAQYGTLDIRDLTIICDALDP